MNNFKLHLVLIGLLCVSTVFSQEALSNFSDGPYVFIENNQLIEKSIVNGKVSSKVLKSAAHDTIFTPQADTYKNIKNVVALSDIHGQYDLAVKLLKNNKIIDHELNWSFGKGHLVIVGDIFDRGDKVNDMLWLVYNLEAQAKKAGGRVHFLLGNHEYMVLHKDLRYIHEKYRITSKLLDLSYDELYGKNTVLGRWLRSKPTIIKINNDVFVHGGISKDFLSKNEFKISQLNNIMRQSLSRSKAEMKSTDFYKIYYGSKSLIWYRGYFRDNLNESEIDDLLKLVNSDHIVVGHCSNNEVVQLYNNKIYGVDSSIKRGKYGEVLFITDHRYYKGTLDGKKIEFKKTTPSAILD